MPNAARKTDGHACPSFTGVVPHVGGPISSDCSPDVDIEGLPAARGSSGSKCDFATCETGELDFIAQGAATVLINDMYATRAEDKTEHNGVITGHAAEVEIGGTTVTFRAILERKPSFADRKSDALCDDSPAGSQADKNGIRAKPTDGTQQTQVEASKPLKPVAKIELPERIEERRFRDVVTINSLSYHPEHGTDPNAGIRDYKWTVRTPAGSIYSYKKSSFSIPLDPPGTYRITLVVVDDEGLESDPVEEEFHFVAHIITVYFYEGNLSVSAQFDWPPVRTNEDHSWAGHVWIGRGECDRPDYSVQRLEEVGFGPVGHGTGWFDDADGDAKHGRNKNNPNGLPVHSYDFFVSRAEVERSRVAERRFSWQSYVVTKNDCASLTMDVIEGAGLVVPYRWTRQIPWYVAEAIKDANRDRIFPRPST